MYGVQWKERNNVAIKNVKLTGKKRNAIEGYANEIVALLRRLRGNQLLYKMYDCQLELELNAMQLVMEVGGEVDLKHVVRLGNTLISNFFQLTLEFTVYHSESYEARGYY